MGTSLQKVCEAHLVHAHEMQSLGARCHYSVCSTEADVVQKHALRLLMLIAHSVDLHYVRRTYAIILILLR